MDRLQVISHDIIIIIIIKQFSESDMGSWTRVDPFNGILPVGKYKNMRLSLELMEVDDV